MSRQPLRNPSPSELSVPRKSDLSNYNLYRSHSSECLTSGPRRTLQKSLRVFGTSGVLDQVEIKDVVALVRRETATSQMSC